jgi:hypothetical protein
MLIVKIDNAYQLERAFEKMGRGNTFTRYDLLVEYYDEIGEDVELDVIALCGEWDEFATIEDYNANYGTTYETVEDLANDETVLHDGAGAFLVVAH